MTVTTDEFLTSLKRNVTIPSQQIRFRDTDLLAMADEQMRMFMSPLITSLRQEFFVVSETIPMASGQSAYKIPYRSIGRTIRDLKVTNSQTPSNIVYTVPYVNPEDTQFFLYNNTVGDIRAVTVRGDNIIVFPTPGDNTTQALQIFYELAPSSFVTVASCGLVTAADVNTGQVTIQTAVSSFATGDTMDLVDGQSGNTATAIDIVNTNVTGAVITFDPDDLPVAPNALKAGDYVCFSNETPVVPLPNEGVMTLVQAVTCKVLEAQGDFEGLAAANEKLGQYVNFFRQVLSPRIESSVPKIVNTNGLIKNRMWRSWYYRYNL